MPNQFGLKTIEEMETEREGMCSESIEYIPQPVVIPWRKIAVRVLKAICAIFFVYIATPWLIAVLHVMAPVHDHEPFCVEADGTRRSLEGYINNLQYTAHEHVKDSLVVRNEHLGEQTLSLYKDDDPKGYRDGQYTLVLANINEWAFMREGLYIIVSEPVDKTQAPDSCRVFVHKKGVGQVDSE